MKSSATPLTPTSIGAGSILRSMLLASEEVKRMLTKGTAAPRIFPVVSEKADLPYIVYRRSALQHNPTKAGMPGADTVTMEVLCLTGDYAKGVELAEAVRRALDYKTTAGVRSCMLTGAEEAWDADAFIQTLIFELKI